MRNKWIFSCFILMSVMITKPTWGFAFFVSNGSTLEISGVGTPVIWEEQNIAIGININRQPFKQLILDGLSEWNNTGANLTLLEGISLGNACMNNDGLNNIALSQNICGLDWGDALGITTLQAETRGGISSLVEADILLRSFDNDPASKWAADNDPLMPEDFSCYTNTQGGTTCDFSRVALHELGHAIGLNHPDEAGQNRKAVMNSGNTLNRAARTLTPDDINGIRTLYDNNRSPITSTAGLESLPADRDNEAENEKNGGGAINPGLIIGLILVAILPCIHGSRPLPIFI
ncbi:MAG: matrixin family metalloprotease [Gammaproteobacteria bacterium]|nr:matrixin family metalloprotease [Gammaproteobacteria bacterium]